MWQYLANTFANLILISFDFLYLISHSIIVKLQFFLIYNLTAKKADVSNNWFKYNI